MAMDNTIPVKKKAGRPTKHGRAMTPAQRMKEYRRNLRIIQTQGMDDPTSASDLVLADLLGQQFRRPHPDAGVHEYLVKKYLQELCNRYKIIE